ncbi:hypothetical protein QCA50_008900 [Cerrena zonata]|uniref:Prolyl 4-hydroxylase alpha subunit Fe(2+) 2OG dioxygenase domain-containing protein n=1 Tax=Cerrena zonata TaxID=2478898 RepID=A0AAW0GC23_9APHY
MFGSLVIVLPTPHEGGELILRDKGNEWTFDSAAITDQQDTPSLAFVAFYGDVEHEVMKVASGYRVSITYNLYTCENQISPPSIPFTNDPTRDELKATFEMLLSDSSFLPIGGYLGFGLRRQYAFQTSRDIIKLSEFEPHLKGSDAILFGVSKELSLSPALIVYFKTQEDDEDEIDVICYNVPVLAHGNSVDDDLLVDHLCDGYGGRRVKTRDDDHFQYRKFPNLYIHWATPLSEFGNVEREYPAYGNEPSLAYAYGCICLLVAVGPYGEREATHKILPLNQKPVVKKVSKKPTGIRGGKTPKSR